MVSRQSVTGRRRGYGGDGKKKGKKEKVSRWQHNNTGARWPQQHSLTHSDQSQLLLRDALRLMPWRYTTPCVVCPPRLLSRCDRVGGVSRRRCCRCWGWKGYLYNYDGHHSARCNIVQYCWWRWCLWACPYARASGRRLAGRSLLKRSFGSSASGNRSVAWRNRVAAI